MFRFFKKKRYRDDEIMIVLYKRYGPEKANGIVNTYVFDIYRVDSLLPIGQCDLRVGNSRYLYYLGHVGYSIFKAYRGHHYAARASLLLCEFAREIGLKELIITCSPENIASYKTLERIGARYIETVDVPEEHDLYRRGEIRKCIFELKL